MTRSNVACYSNGVVSEICENKGDTGNSLVAVAYYPDYSEHLIGTILALKLRLDIKVVIVVSNNRLISSKAFSDQLEEKCQAYHFVEHDNVGGEFGAYQAGIDFVLNATGRPSDFVILNDTLGIHYPFYSEHLNAFTRIATDSRWVKKLGGRLDHSERRLTIGYLSGSRWVRSNLMFIDQAALKSINHCIFDREINEWIKDTPLQDQLFADEIGAYARERFIKWLFEPSGWYGAAPLSLSNYKRLRFKAQAVLQELYLTMRLEQAGAAILDFDLFDNEQHAVAIKNRVKRLLRRFRIDHRPTALLI